MNNWRNLWDKKGRELNLNKSDLVESLFNVSGYKSPVSKTTTEEWIEFIHIISSQIDIRPTDSVYEVGCGAGSFLYNIDASKKGGCDYSAGHIEQAKDIIDSDDLTACEAKDIPTDPQYDVVVAVGCFLYMPDSAYAYESLGRMCKKSNRVIAVVDVNDLSQKELALEVRKKTAGPNYEKIYEGLDHLFLDQLFFLDFAESNGLSCKFLPHPLPAYPYRFTAVMTKGA